MDHRTKGWKPQNGWANLINGIIQNVRTDMEIKRSTRPQTTAPGFQRPALTPTSCTSAPLPARMPGPNLSHFVSSPPTTSAISTAIPLQSQMTGEYLHPCSSVASTSALQHSVLGASAALDGAHFPEPDNMSLELPSAPKLWSSLHSLLSWAVPTTRFIWPWTRSNVKSCEILFFLFLWYLSL